MWKAAGLKWLNTSEISGNNRNKLQHCNFKYLKILLRQCTTKASASYKYKNDRITTFWADWNVIQAYLLLLQTGDLVLFLLPHSFITFIYTLNHWKYLLKSIQNETDRFLSPTCNPIGPLPNTIALSTHLCQIDCQSFLLLK